MLVRAPWEILSVGSPKFSVRALGPVDEQDGGHDSALEQGRSAKPRRKTQALPSRPTAGTASLSLTRNAGLAALRLKAGRKVTSGGKTAFLPEPFASTRTTNALSVCDTSRRRPSVSIASNSPSRRRFGP